MCYEYAPQKYTAPPAGYKPFYINHLGRHGSRNHTSESLFPSLSSLLGQAAEQGLLTSQGEELRSRIDRVKKSMDKRYGDLTQKGARGPRKWVRSLPATY